MPLPGTSKLTSAFVSCSSQDQAYGYDADEYEGKMTNCIEASRRWCVGEEPTNEEALPPTLQPFKLSRDGRTQPTVSPLCLVCMARVCAVRQDNFDDLWLHNSAGSLRVWRCMAGPEGRVWALGL